MATQSVKLQELDRRLRKVEQQLATFTRDTRRKSKSPARKKKPSKGLVRTTQLDHAQTATARDIAQRAGLLAELPPQARARIERPLSDIIIENRQ